LRWRLWEEYQKYIIRKRGKNSGGKARARGPNRKLDRHQGVRSTANKDYWRQLILFSLLAFKSKRHVPDDQIKWAPSQKPTGGYKVELKGKGFNKRR